LLKGGQLEKFEKPHAQEEQQVGSRIESREEDMNEQDIGAADRISTASGPLILVQFALQSQTLLHRAVKSLHSKKKSMREIIEELESLNMILQSLEHEIVTRTDAEFSSLDLALLRFGKDCDGFKAAIVQWKSNTERYTTKSEDWAKMTYMGVDIVGLKNLLGGYKSTFFIAFTSLNI
jgi:hypothetical protein